MSNHASQKREFLQTFVITALLVACLTAVPARADVGDELFKLTASDRTPADLFGYSVGVSGNIAIVGAYGNDAAGPSAGAAYLFDVTTGGQMKQLIASDAAQQDLFGRSVGISGNVAIVGATDDDDAGSNSGSAYLFDVATGHELFRLKASDAAADDYFGASVAISGNMAIVGAWGDDDSGSENGSAYLFDVTTGQQLFKLTPSDTSAFSDRFGESVAISGNTAIVGAPGNKSAGTDSGSAYLFDVTTGQELFKLNAPAVGGQFGASVGISGNTAIVGLAYDLAAGYQFGAAYLFDVATGQELFKLVASDAAAGEFVRAVAISDDVAIIGSPHSPGSAYLFDVATGEQLAKLIASDAAEYDTLGFAVAISGDTALVGSPAVNLDFDRVPGSAYVYSAVPEPGSLVLLIVGLPIVVCRYLLRKTERKIP